MGVASEPAISPAAAATFCGLAVTTISGSDQQLNFNVSNLFYATRSWVHADGQLDEVLKHEQGHFDLCEVYRRKLSEAMDTIKLYTPGHLMMVTTLFEKVNKEYLLAQAEYERTTSHGTNSKAQQQWEMQISATLQPVLLSRQ